MPTGPAPPSPCCLAQRALLGLAGLLLAAQQSQGETAPLPAVGEAPLGRRAILACQAALEGKGYSPGLVDGIAGPKTQLAIRVFQATIGMPVTGECCAETQRALGVSLEDEPATLDYAILPEDEAEVGYWPTDWNERSQLDRLPYPDLANLTAEKFHTSERCLAYLNPGIDLSALTAGSALVVPRLREREPPKAELSLIVELERKLVILLDEAGEVKGLLHCSVAKDVSAIRRGETSVINVVTNPRYTFDPKKWPEVKNVTQKLDIPPGPRCPVGIRWIGLDQPGVGIHGSPEPANIGKTGSHGCFRLTNWDAAFLASAVKIGTRVRIVDRAAELDALLGEMSVAARYRRDDAPPTR